MLVNGDGLDVHTCIKLFNKQYKKNIQYDSTNINWENYFKL